MSFCLPTSALASKRCPFASVGAHGVKAVDLGRWRVELFADSLSHDRRTRDRARASRGTVPAERRIDRRAQWPLLPICAQGLAAIGQLLEPQRICERAKKNARPIETGRASDEELCFLKGRALLGRTGRIASQTERLLYGNAKTDRRKTAIIRWSDRRDRAR